MRLQQGDLGARVVVRHRLADGRATDVIGALVALDDTVLTVRPATGPDVRVPLADVVASRVVTSSVTHRVAGGVVGQRRVGGTASTDDRVTGDDGEGAAGLLATPVDVAAARSALGWPGRHVEPLGGWLLRSGPARMMRGRSALAVGDPGMPLPDALEAVTHHYRSTGLLPAVQVSSPLPGRRPGPAGRTDADAPSDHDTHPGADPHDGPARLETLLAASGWEPRPWTVLALRPARASPAGPAASSGTSSGPLPTAPPMSCAVSSPTSPSSAVAVRPSPDRAWLAASDHHGAPLTLADLPPERDGVALAYASVHAEGHEQGVVGVARGALAERWLGITCVSVDAAHRRRGLAGALLAGLEDELGEGADAVFVQVEADNRGARAAWRSAGFADHSRYRFWTLPDAT